MRKKIYSVCLFLFGALYSNAEMQYMIVEQKTGEKYSFLLDDNPVITYQEGNLVVNGDATTSYAIADVKNYHFAETSETGVVNQLAAALQIESIDESTILVKNAAPSCGVVLSDASGRTVYTSTSDTEGRVTVSLPKQSGVFVLTIGKQSIKLVRK